MADQAGSKKKLDDLQRIQEIEQRVVDCIEKAAVVADELSKIGNVNKQKVMELCAEFLSGIKAAQGLVQEAVENPISERSFEANVYHSMARAGLAFEKVSVVSSHLSSIQSLLHNAEEAQTGLSTKQENAEAEVGTSQKQPNDTAAAAAAAAAAHVKTEQGDGAAGAVGLVSSVGSVAAGPATSAHAQQEGLVGGGAVKLEGAVKQEDAWAEERQQPGPMDTT